MAGLLGEDYEDPATQGLLSAGLSMLAASGPSTKRTSVGQVLGLGGLQGMQAYQQAQKMALLKAEEERRKQEAKALEEYRKMQMEQMRAAMDDKKKFESFLSNPANFMQMTQPQSAVGDYGPGEAPTVGPNTTGMRPKSMADIATTMILSGHPALAQAGLASLAKVKGELRTVGNALYDEETGQWKVPPKPQEPEKDTQFEQTLKAAGILPGTPEWNRAMQAKIRKETYIQPTQFEINMGEKKDAKQRVSDDLLSIKDAYDELKAAGGAIETGGNVVNNAINRAMASDPGQVVGQALGTKAQAARDKIATIRPLLIQEIRRATGMSARQMDSNVELKFNLAAATDPTKGHDVNLAAIELLDKQFGLGLGITGSAKGKAKLYQEFSGTGLGKRNIPQAAIDALRANPSLRDSFDQKYGTGAALDVLGN